MIYEDKISVLSKVDMVKTQTSLSLVKGFNEPENRNEIDRKTIFKKYKIYIKEFLIYAGGCFWIFKLELC